MGKLYHNPCFKCKQCNKGLQLTDYTPQGDEIYCKSCHGSLFGPGGFRGGGGSTTIGVKTHSAVDGGGGGGGGKFCAGCGAKASGGKFCSDCGKEI